MLPVGIKSDYAFIFIFYDKKIFKVDKTNSIYEIMGPQYEQREKDNAEIVKWMAQCIKTHKEVEIFFDNDELRIYQIHIPRDLEKKFKRIWEDQEKVN